MPEIALPKTIESALANGAHLVLSVSGGKDSDAMSYKLLAERRARGWTGDIVMVHADLGRMERSETPAYVESLAARTRVELVVVRHPKGDLLDGLYRRRQARPDAPPFPSSAARWCTSDFKRAQISKFIRNRWPQNAVIACALGVRAEESPARAKKPVMRERRDCCAPTKKRTTYDWNPILYWNAAQVWWQIREAGNIYHPAYDGGNERLSCAMCVLGCAGDIRNGAYNRPDTYRALVDLELESGFTYQQGKPLYEVAPDLLRPDQRAAIAAMTRNIETTGKVETQWQSNATARYAPRKFSPAWAG